MQATELEFSSGGKVQIDVAPASKGDGVIINQHFTTSSGTKSTTVTCTCTDANGGTHSTTKQCPNGNNTCDCSTPSSPKIICG